MTLIATGDGNENTDQPIANAAFFADTIKLVEYRDASRIDRTAQDDQAIEALKSAIVQINQQLAESINAWVAAGHATIDDLPAPLHMPAGYYKERYRQAIYNAADALLAENFRDFDSTGEGHGRADAMQERIDSYRRESNYAVADLLSRPRVRVGLL